MGTVITIDNFRTKMSSFDPNAAKEQNEHLYALVDMGSNGIRFSISDLSPPTSRLLHCLYRERASISLYDALHSSDPGSQLLFFSPSTISTVADTLARFRSISDSYGVKKSNISVFATEAMRTALNQPEMLDAIRKESGLEVDILAPGMESLFGAMGARSGFTTVKGVFMDLGGGSVQMTYVDSSLPGSANNSGYDILAAEAATSLPFGAAKLTEALSTTAKGEAAKMELRSGMKATFSALCDRFPSLKEQRDSGEGIRIYFCGGGFRGYGSMLMHTDPIQPYPIPAIGGYKVPGHTFIKWREMLHANNYDSGKVFGMSKRRREQFPAITTVVQSLVEAIPKIKDVIFCSGGNREGVLFMKLPPHIRESHPIPLLPSPGRHRDPETLKAIAGKLQEAMPKGFPAIFDSELLHFLARNIWIHTGHDANGSRALHNSISGDLAGLPGLDHELCGVIALVLVSRWGGDLGPVDARIATNLQALVGDELAWWCQYIGAVARFFETVVPAFPSSPSQVTAIKFEPSTSAGLGKKGHKVGVRLKIQVPGSICRGLYIGDLEDLFSKVGKGVGLAWKVEAEVVEV